MCVCLLWWSEASDAADFARRKGQKKHFQFVGGVDATTVGAVQEDDLPQSDALVSQALSMVFASRHQYSSASKSYDQTTKIERKFNCRPLERIQEPRLPLNRFVTMITVALENRKDRLYHLTYVRDITWLNVIVYIIIRSLAFYCPTHCLQPFGQDYKRSQPVWISVLKNTP